jgi:hypothetical protein
MLLTKFVMVEAPTANRREYRHSKKPPMQGMQGIADCQLPIAGCRLPIADCRLPVFDF